LSCTEVELEIGNTTLNWRIGMKSRQGQRGLYHIEFDPRSHSKDGDLNLSSFSASTMLFRDLKLACGLSCLNISKQRGQGTEEN
jgi:hypothetical protein